MLRTLLLASAALSLAACGGEVTDGGTGSDTDFDEIEAMQDEGVSERSEIAGTDPGGQPLQEGAQAAARPGDPRAGDYPAPGEEQTRNPIEPGNEEPGGKDMVLQKEYEAMGIDAPSAMRAPLEEVRMAAAGPVAEYDGKLYLSRRGVSLGHLGRAPVLNAAGEEGLSVADVLVSPMGELKAFVIQEGDTLGVPGAKHLVQPTEVAFGRTGDDANLTLQLGGDIEAAPGFDEDAVPEGMVRASELLRQAVRVGGDEETAAIADVVMSPDGVLYGIALAYTGERYLVEPGMIARGEDEDSYALAITEQQLRAMPSYVGVPAYEER